MAGLVRHLRQVAVVPLAAATSASLPSLPLGGWLGGALGSLLNNQWTSSTAGLAADVTAKLAGSGGGTTAVTTAPPQHVWCQRRGYRTSRTFDRTDGSTLLEERRRQHLARHTVTADEAIQAILPGPHRVLIGSGAAEPALLVQAMMDRGAELSGSEVMHLLTLGPAPYVEPPASGHFRHTAFFIGGNVRRAVAEGRAGFMPVFLSELPSVVASPELGVQVALIQVSRPDAHGFVSLGVSVDVVHAACRAAHTVLAEVNLHMPRTHGDTFVPVEAIDYFVVNDSPLPELSPCPPDDVSLAIGRHVAALIPNGATLQMGIGKIPNAVAHALREHSDLGVHTEVLTDGVAELAQRGVVTCAAKTFMRGKVVATLALGSERLYAWADDNPMLSMHPCDFTNDPQLIARNDAMAAINAALAVDLTGQVASDTLAGNFYSGIGGQVDFIRGAARSRGGLPIIALPSTAAGGSASRIVPDLGPGGAVTTCRGDVHWVVTEFGAAQLWGRSVRQRAEALISIASPQFREELHAYARSRHWL